MKEEDFDIEEYPNLKSQLEQFAEDVISKYRMKMSSHNASGQLLNNLSYTIDSGSTNIKVMLQIADYYRYLEEGRPPTTNGGDGTLKDKILQWIKVKGIQPYPDKNGKLPSEESLSYLITRKIHREGYDTPPQHCLVESVQETWQQYEQTLNEALEKDFIDLYTVKIMNRIKKIRV